MKTWINKHWVSGIALLILSLLSFSALAATQQITGRQIANQTITDNNIANGTIQSLQIAANTILNGDISDNTIAYGKIATLNTPTDEFCFTYEATGDAFAWQSCAGGTFFDTAGTGLTGTGTSTVNANASDNSITMAADAFSVNTGNGLQVTTNLNVKSDAVGGANLATVVNVSSNGVAVAIDDTTIGVSSNRLYVKDASITGTQLAASVAGAGLTGGAGSALAVGAGTGITVNANDVAVNSSTVLFRADVIANEVPNEACDGSRVNFTVDNTVVQTWTVTINGIEQRPTTDFSLAGLTYTLTTACATGDSILIDYTK